MAQQEIELILTRQLASSLATPCLVFDPQGTLIFYNEPAETIMGQRFEETGAMLVSELARIFTATDGRGTPLPADALPLTIALLTRRPAYKRFWIRSLDGVRRQIASSAFPIIGEAGQFLGAMAIVPEVHDKGSAPPWVEARPPGLTQPGPGAPKELDPQARGGFAARPQKEIEVILTRQLASYLATPIIIVDPRGTLLYYNEPGETIIGLRFEEAGEVPASVWLTVSSPTDRAGKRLPPSRHPLMVALAERRPAHRRFWIRGRDGVRRQIEVVAIPIIGQAERFLGGMALFWEVKD
jgi:PAS domain-containing protein